MPNRICLQCVNKLESAYVLKMTFKESIFNFADKQKSDQIQNSNNIDENILETENEKSKSRGVSVASYSCGIACNENNVEENFSNFVEKQNSDDMEKIIVNDNILELKNEMSEFIIDTSAASSSYEKDDENSRDDDDEMFKEIYENIYQNRKFQCTICHRRYHLKGEWKTHQERHELKEKQFKCCQCGLTFLTNKHFKSHLCRRQK